LSKAGEAARVRSVIRGLRRLYPDAECELDFKNPLELIVAAILSAQCTDKRVNLVTKTLFKRYQTAEDYASARLSELEKLVHSTGFFRSKAKSIKEMAKVLVSRHGGRVPDRMDALTSLRGVARKTANVVLGTAYGKAEGIVVDTHMKRLAFRLGFTKETDPVKVERDLMARIPRMDWVFFGHGMVRHGRRVCRARKPDCEGCKLLNLCPRNGL